MVTKSIENIIDYLSTEEGASFYQDLLAQEKVSRKIVFLEKLAGRWSLIADRSLLVFLCL